VLTKYGEICEASFDMSFPTAMDSDITDTFMLARQLAPNTLFRGRGMGGKKEDGGCKRALFPSCRLCCASAIKHDTRLAVPHRLTHGCRGRLFMYTCFEVI